MGSIKNVIQSLTNRKPRKLFDYLYKLPDYGVGRQFTRVIWKHDNVTTNYKGSTRWGDPLSYWTITRVKPDGVSKEYDDFLSFSFIKTGTQSW